MRAWASFGTLLLVCCSWRCSSSSTIHLTRLRIAKQRLLAAAASGDSAVLAGGGVQFGWATPLLRYDVAHGEDGGSVEALNRELREAVLHDLGAYRQQQCVESASGVVMRSNVETSCGTTVDAETEYNQFFRAQLQLMRDATANGEAAADVTALGTALPHLRASTAYRRLVSYLQQAVDEFLLAAGWAPERVAGRALDDLFVWANVQNAGVAHLAHVVRSIAVILC